jgi:hypothetical protein
MVKFGNGEKASIAVTAQFGVLTLQMLATEKNIGEAIEPADGRELPKVEIEFFTPKSIDVLIGALEVIKKNYIPPGERNEPALAC